MPMASLPRRSWRKLSVRAMLEPEPRTQVPEPALTWWPAVAAAPLVHVGALTQVTELGLSATDGGLVHLQGLVKLRKLDLAGPVFSDGDRAALEVVGRGRELLLGAEAPAASEQAPTAP